MVENLARIVFRWLIEVSQIPSTIVMLVILLVIAAIVLDAIFLHSSKTLSAAGLEKAGSSVTVEGTASLPVQGYVSEIQGLAGRPDALIKENGAIIPVERKPLARKLRDRYVAQLLVYMRLVEEFEGKKPPYGYLILGPSCKKVRIDNTEERQKWLQGVLDEMRGVLNGGPVKPLPEQKKCRKCPVNNACEFKVSN